MARRYARRASRERDHSWKFVPGNLFWSFRSFRIGSGGNSLRQYVGPDFCCLEMNITYQHLNLTKTKDIRRICDFSCDDYIKVFRSLSKFVLHLLIHTLPLETSAQDVEKKKAEAKTPHFLSLNQDIVAG